MDELRLIMPFRTHLFTFSQIEYTSLSVHHKPERLFTCDYMIITVMQGRGSSFIDGKRSLLTKGGCFLIPPGSLVEFENTGSGLLELNRLRFGVEKAGAEDRGLPAGEAEAAELFPIVGKLNIQPFGEWSDQLANLYRNRDHVEGLSSFRQHIRLQELLYYICVRNLPSIEQDPRSAVSETINELHADVTQDSSIKLLAARANMGTRQYTYLFKELTGRSPLDYVTELRINQAKKQLLLTNDQLQTVAHNVGYQDVYYFSRRFKQLVGMSPKQFASQRRRQLRIVALYYSGTLASVGVRPVGANLTWWGGSEFLEELESGMIDVGSEPSLELLAKLEPDLILMNSCDHVDQERYSKIAPAVIIPYDGKRGIYEEARLVGELVNHSKEAEQFIARYEHKARVARAAVTEVGVAAEASTAAIIRIEDHGRQFSIFGENYGRCGWTIYRGFRFKAPPKVQSMIETGVQIEQYIPIERLPEYVGTADYLFVINEGEGMAQLSGTGSTMWARLPAVMNRRTFELAAAKFSYFDPITLEAQLDLLVVLLIEQAS